MFTGLPAYSDTSCSDTVRSSPLTATLFCPQLDLHTIKMFGYSDIEIRSPPTVALFLLSQHCHCKRGDLYTVLNLNMTKSTYAKKSLGLEWGKPGPPPPPQYVPRQIRYILGQGRELWNDFQGGWDKMSRSRCRSRGDFRLQAAKTINRAHCTG